MDGNILCEEAKRYVGNFVAVHRVRDVDDSSEDGNSDDLISDAELDAGTVAVKTKRSCEKVMPPQKLVSTISRTPKLPWAWVKTYGAR